MPPLATPALSVWNVSVQADTRVGPWRYSMWVVELTRLEAEKACLGYLEALLHPATTFRIARVTGSPAYGWRADQAGRVYSVKAGDGTTVPT